MTKIAVVGGGAWGTALAAHLARRDHRAVVLWARRDSDVQAMSTQRVNQRYLEGVELPMPLAATSDLGAAVAAAELVLFVVPTHTFRSVVQAAAGAIRADATVVSASKGIESGRLVRMTEILEQELPGRPAVALSGPTFALEVARREPTVAVAASRDALAAARVQAAISDERFRIYTSDDVVGVELAGALKNVMAIAAGIVAGMGFGSNTLAAIVTRGLSELSRLGSAFGGRPETFAGIAGMGDLVLTCTGQLSRNRQVGVELGRGRPLPEILASIGHVAEGVRNTATALALAERGGVELPMARQVQRILDGEIAPAEAVRELMTRTLKSEVA